MGNLLIAFILIIGGILGSAFAKILADEFKAWRPTVVHRLIGIAASLLSGDDRERYQEEWSAYVEEVPGDLGKLISAGGFVFAAMRMSDRRLMALGSKRAMDISLAVIALIFLSPPVLIAALALKIESPRASIFFAQRRIGRGGKEFRLLRFRTMRPDAEVRLDELLRSNPSARAEWEETFKLKNDPRITIVGKILRKSSFDEIPQLVNILRGEMSIVGPRALPPEFNAQDDFEQISKLRHSMRPGITGLGQIAFLFSQKDRLLRMLEADMIYIKAQSLFLDLGIIINAVAAIFDQRKQKLAQSNIWR